MNGPPKTGKCYRWRQRGAAEHIVRVLPECDHPPAGMVEVMVVSDGFAVIHVPVAELHELHDLDEDDVRGMAATG